MPVSWVTGAVDLRAVPIDTSRYSHLRPPVQPSKEVDINENPEFLVIGEAIVDVVRSVDGNQTAHAGGSPANVAYGLGRLGRGVRFVTQVGADGSGDLIRAHLDLANVHVDVALVERTGSALATVDLKGSARYHFDIAWTLDEVESPFARHVHAGSIGAYLAPGAATVEQLMTDARAYASTSFDPNIRPPLLGDRAEALHRTKRLIGLSDVVKVSDEDLEWLYPGQDAAVVAQDLLSLGPALVAVTRGGEGAFAVTHAGTVHVPSVPVQVVDTVGAGDSFMAAMLDGLSAADLLGADRRERLVAVSLPTTRAVLTRAAAAAGITVSRPGANPPSRAELEPSSGRSVLTGHSGRYGDLRGLQLEGEHHRPRGT